MVKKVNFVFEKNHPAMESTINNRNLKVEDHSAKSKRIVCGGFFHFQRAMKMDDIISEVITIPIPKADIDKSKGEEVPPRGVLKVLQLIIEEEPTKETTKTSMKINKERKGKLGKDPDGKKAGVNVNPKFVSRLSGCFAHYKILSTEEDIFVA